MTAALALVLAITALKLALYRRQWRSLPPAHPLREISLLRTGLALLQASLTLAMLQWLAAASQPPSPAAVIALLVGFALLQRLPEHFLLALRQFVFEARRGRRRLSLARWLGDTGTALVLRALAALPLATVAVLAQPALGAAAWLAPWLAGVLGAQLAERVQRGWVLPKQERQTEFPPGPLRDRLAACFERAAVPGVALRLAQGSLRSTQANARAERVGGRCRVVLFDTLTERLAAAEVEAVAAHELAHVACGHLRSRHLRLALIWLLCLAAAALVAAQGLPQGLADWRAPALMLWLAPQLRFLGQPWLLAAYRRWEFEADAWAARAASGEAMQAALLRIEAVNGTMPAGDTLHGWFHDSHPPLLARLAALWALR